MEVEVVSGEGGESSEDGAPGGLLLLQLGGTCDDHLVEEAFGTFRVA